MIPMLNQLISLKMKMEQNQFKAFDQVLVRDANNECWRAGIYSHYKSDDEFPYKCIGVDYSQCIPYNENTQHLVGTNQPYSPPQPKEYYVSWGPDSEMEQTEFTAEQFERFIKTAVINNKDISNFMVKRIKR